MKIIGFCISSLLLSIPVFGQVKLPIKQSPDVDIYTQSINQEVKIERDSLYYNFRKSYLDGPPSDVILDVPKLEIDSLKINVRNLDANLDLKVSLGKMLSIRAGADVLVDSVDIDLHGVKAEALLLIRLENIQEILQHTMETLSENPEIISELGQVTEEVTSTVSKQVPEVLNQTTNAVSQTLEGKQANQLISSMTNSAGEIVHQEVDQTGNIVQSTLNGSGQVKRQQIVGNLTDLKLLDKKMLKNGRVSRSFALPNQNKTVKAIWNAKGQIESVTVQ
jgi:hypothetical protein